MSNAGSANRPNSGIRVMRTTPLADISCFVVWPVPQACQALSDTVLHGLGERLRELAFVQVGVEPAAREQRGVVALLDDRTVVHDQDRVGVADGREAVSDDEGGLAGPQAAHRALDQDLGPR